MGFLIVLGIVASYLFIAGFACQLRNQQTLGIRGGIQFGLGWPVTGIFVAGKEAARFATKGGERRSRREIRRQRKEVAKEAEHKRWMEKKKLEIEHTKASLQLCADDGADIDVAKTLHAVQTA